MKNIKYCFTAYRPFDQLLTIKPMMTGCYQWIRVFNGQCKSYAELKDEVDKYDVIQVNLDPMDIQMLPKLKELTKNSSTILIGNHDHSPELWAKSMEHPHAWKHIVNSCDAVFATTPTAQTLLSNLLDRTIDLIPHPCETHVMKRVGSSKKFDHIGVVHHRYDNNVLMPFLHLEKFNKTLTLMGYQENEDPRARNTKCLYDNILPYMPFPDFIKVLKEAYYLYDSYDGYSYGRIGCDTACLQTPLVGSNKVYSHQLLYPYTSVDQYDTKDIQNKFDKLINDGEFYEKVIKYAYEKVEQFNWINSRKKFEEMLDNVKKK